MKIHPKLASRKLWLALLATALPPICSFVTGDVDLHEALRLSVAAVIAYCVSQGYVDGKTMEGWVPSNLQEPEASGDE